MTYDEWQPRYRRLVKTFNKTESGEQCAAYYEALQSYTDTVIEHAIAQTVAEERYWPAVASIRQRCQDFLAGRVYQAPTCARCSGNGFIDAPDEQHHGRTYPNYVRACPDCHVPMTRERVA